MRKIINYSCLSFHLLAASLILAGCSHVPDSSWGMIEAGTNARGSNDEEALLNFNRLNLGLNFEELVGNCDTLIVGCGKNPSAWQDQSASRGQVNIWRLGQATGDVSVTGSHDHKNCVTLAEASHVEPDIVWNWTEPIPKKLHEQFSLVYLEKLPPHVLDHPVCMRNLYDILAPGGQAVLDHQLSREYGETLKMLSPFRMSVPREAPPNERQKVLEEKRNRLAKEFNEELDALGIPRETRANKEAYANLLAENLKLEELNKEAFGINRELAAVSMNNQVVMSAQLRPEAVELVKELMEQYGFEKVKSEEVQKTPFNGRKNEQLVSAQKPHRWGCAKSLKLLAV